MARRTNSLLAPEQGYSHRDHRSKKGRVPGGKRARELRRLRRLWNEIRLTSYLDNIAKQYSNGYKPRTRRKDFL